MNDNKNNPGFLPGKIWPQRKRMGRQVFNVGAQGSRYAQNLALGLGRSVTVAGAITLTGTLQRDSLLQDLSIVTADLALIEDVTVAGQNTNVTTSGASARMFHPDAQFEGHRSAGIPLKERQAVSVQVTDHANATGSVSAGWATDPIRNKDIPSTSTLGKALDWFGGLGTVSVVQGALTEYTLSTTVQRACIIGALSLDAPVAALGEIMVTSVEINNLQMLSGGDTADERAVPLEMFGFESTDIEGKSIGYKVDSNTNMTIKLKNYSATTDFNVYGGFYCIPDVFQAFNS